MLIFALASHRERGHAVSTRVTSALRGTSYANLKFGFGDDPGVDRRIEGCDHVRNVSWAKSGKLSLHQLAELGSCLSEDRDIRISTLPDG